MKDFEVTADQTGSHVDVRGVLHSEGTWLWYSPDLSVSFTVRVPRECRLKIHTAEGCIEIRDVKGAMKGETSMGDISIAGTDGEGDFETFSGSVSADSCAGTIGMRTSCGGVRMTAIHGDIDVSSSAGDVAVLEAEGRIRAQTGGGNVTVRLRGSNRGVHAETSGGDIDLFLPPGTAGTIDATAGGGVVSLELPARLAGEAHLKEVNGKINGGGNTIYAHTLGGNVRLRSAP